MQLQPARSRAPRRLSTLTTNDPDWVRRAQILRYDIFSAEYGSDLGATEPGIDADHFDTLCDHVIVVDHDNNEPVATTRILHQRALGKSGGFYSENEFNLSRLKQVEGTFAELGRTCVHPDYRNGATIGFLWSAVCEYLLSEKVDYLIGCASIGMADGGLKAWRVAQHLKANYLADDRFRVSPNRELPHLTKIAPAEGVDQSVPALIAAYMRLGARVCGDPCWDPDFRCADLLVLLDVERMSARYTRHFMRRANTAVAV